MKTIRIILLVSLTATLVGCGASQKVQEPNAILDEMIAEKSFEIAVSVVQPMVTQAWSQIANSGLVQQGNSPGRINVSGSGYFIKVKGDSVSANLPYFGERQMGGGYNLNSGIEFKGTAKNMTITKDEIKKNYTVDFRIPNKTEVFIVSTTIGRNLGSNTSVFSSHRNRIWYVGEVQKAAAN